MLFIAYTEFGNYFGGYVEQQYIVDPEIRENVQINLDLYVHLKCEYIHVNVRDSTMDRKIASEELKFEDMPFFIPYDVRVNDLPHIVTPDMDDILGEAIPAEFREKIDMRSYYDEDDPNTYHHLPELDGCHIFGSVPVNRVSGELQITAKGVGYRDFKTTPTELINFAHVINEFSFGDFYPYIDNPLDASAKFDMDDPQAAYVYYTSVVPTIYQKLGAEVDTNQYSVSEYRYHSNDGSMLQSGYVPGIFFRYNFESLTIVVMDKRLSFLQFVVRLVAIISFAIYIASWFFTLTDLFLVTFIGPKWSLQYQPDIQSHGILE